MHLKFVSAVPSTHFGISIGHISKSTCKFYYEDINKVVNCTILLSEVHFYISRNRYVVF